MSIQDTVWTLKYAPKSIDDLILSDKNREYFSALETVPNNLVFLGKTGCGKTTLAKILANKFAPNSYLYINASDENGIDVIRTKISGFISTVSFDGNQKIIILDECDGLSFPAQRALRILMEEYLEDVKFILTGNYKHAIIDALLSRGPQFEFALDLKDVARRVMQILVNEKIKLADESKPHLRNLITSHFPDIRKIINELQRYCINGEFKYSHEDRTEIAVKVFEMLKTKTDVFKIREFVIGKESEFNNDYHFLMRNLFDLSVKECNIEGSLFITDHMYKDALVLDKEVNFSALLFNLSKL
jgi:replication factor C small subunit